MTTSLGVSKLKQPFVGRWRIISANCFDRDYLDLATEAHLIVPSEGVGEMEFGAHRASLDFSVAPGMLVFEFHGSDEGEEAFGEGFMELTDEDEAEIELEWKSGDSAVMKAVRTAKF